MRTRLTDDIKTAMKSGDKRRLGTLRLINAAIKDRDLNAHVDDQGKPTGVDKITDQDILSVLQKMIKQRRESIATYRQGNREDLAAQELEEITVIEGYLPQQLTEDEIRAAITELVAALDAKGLKDMGRVMAALKERFTGSMDFGKASGILKEALK